jgi:hypothetical protein
MALIGFYNAVEYVVIASTALSPVMKFFVFGAQYISPSTPTVVGKTAPKRKQSAFQLSPPIFPGKHNPHIFLGFVDVQGTVTDGHRGRASFVVY